MKIIYTFIQGLQLDVISSDTLKRGRWVVLSFSVMFTVPFYHNLVVKIYHMELFIIGERWEAIWIRDHVYACVLKVSLHICRIWRKCKDTNIHTHIHTYLQWQDIHNMHYIYVRIKASEFVWFQWWGEQVIQTWIERTLNLLNTKTTFLVWHTDAPFLVYFY